MKKVILILFFIFLITLSLRLFITFQNEEFSNDKAYYTLRQIEHIKDTGKLIIQDDLSYSGKQNIDSPFYYYFLTLFSFLMPLSLLGKIIPNILASLSVIIIFYITLYLSQDNKIALLTAFISGFVPIYFSQTVDSISVYSLVIPLTIFIIYCLLRIDENKFVKYFIISVLILSLTSASSFLVIVALLFYLLFLKLEKLRLKKKEIELIVFSMFLIIIINFWVYKDAFLFHGTSLVWQNLPKDVLTKVFLEFNLLGALYLIGLIPFIAGIYVIYSNLFSKKKNRFTFLLISFAISIGLLLWLRLVQLRIGLIFLGIILILLFAQFMKKFWFYLNKTKFSGNKDVILVLIFFLLLLSSIWPSYTYSQREIKNNPTKDEVEAFLWLNGKEGTVLGLLDEGHLITYYGKSKNVWDSNFLMIYNIDQIEKDVKTMFTTKLETKGIELLEKYNVKYIYYGKVRRKYGSIPYINDECFDIPYENNNVRIYEVLCKLT